MPIDGHARGRGGGHPASAPDERGQGATRAPASASSRASAPSTQAAPGDGRARKAVSKSALQDPQQIIDVEDWTLYEFASVDSTNLVAAHFPVWYAVRAETQTAGRGRFQRTWISDQGGLWLSAVVPLKRDKPKAASRARPQAEKVPGRRSLGPSLCGLPLVAGLAVCEALRELGVEGLRMRWPNDVLVYDRKLCGLLLDQFHPDRVVVGIGLNVRNQPEARDGTLKNHVTRLAEVISVTPSLSELTGLVLRHLHRLMRDSSTLGFPAMLPLVNLLWGPPRRVELALDTGLCRGLFTRVDREGCLILQDESGGRKAYDPTEVRHLQEI
jgi:BirA family transcriptional regulator, biotin operon repressor / biotin---[acetyl-CoA-carboxylase] ligase